MKKINRRTTLKGLAGISLALPYLEVMGDEKAETKSAPKRFCALYTANGMSLPKEQNKIADWHWFPHQTGSNFQFNSSTKPLEKFRDELTFFSGFHHTSGPKSDPHTCSDMWLTGAPLHNPKPGTYNTVSLDQMIARYTKQHCRQPSLVMSIDAGVGFTSRTGTISYNLQGKPIPAENNPLHIFNRLFMGNADSAKKQKALLDRKMKLVDAVLENSKEFNRELGKTDKDTLSQYLTSLNELEKRIKSNERWTGIPLKKQDYTNLDFEYDLDVDPLQYYKTMLDLIALTFDADLTRSVVFMLNREDGMGISDTFPLKLGLSKSHHQLSHAGDPTGQTDFAKYDLFLSECVGHFLESLKSYKDNNGSLLDNTMVLFGSGASTTHNSTNLPTLLAGGKNMGVQHGTHYHKDGERLSNLYLSIMKSMDININQFGESTKPIQAGVFNV
ncbi:MAG: DUF1552 domain-containing protein [Pirellulales bacterium]